MSAIVEDLMDKIRHLSEQEQRELAERLDEEAFYREAVRHMLQEWDNPEDSVYDDL